MTAALTCCVLTCRVVVLLLLLCATVTGDVALASARGMTSRPTQKHHHRHQHLDQDQDQDQNLQFMLGLYRSAAGPDGRLKQYRKFGSNTVRLLRPSVTSVRYLSAWRDHHYTFTVEYSLDSLPLDQLVRASFLHFRSPSSASFSSRSPWASRPLPPCRARVHYLGVERHPSSPPPPARGEAVSLEPHHQWTETDVTAHVSQHILRGTNAHLTLMAQYRCTDPGYFSGRAEVDHPSWWRQAGKRASTMRRRRRMMRRRRRPRRGRSRTGDVAPGYHLEMPSLLLYLEEQREGQDWLEELLAGEDQGLARLWWPHRYASHNKTKNNRYRRSSSSSSSSSSSNSSAKDPPPETSVDPSKDLATLLSSSKPLKSSSSKSSSSSSEPIPGRPNYRRKTGVPRNRCRLHSFRLSFEDLGLGHYFIAPPVYNPRYCQGECPPVLHAGYHSPYHAIIQTVMRELAVGEDVPAPSCVPYKYMPMSVLVHHKSRVEYRELEDMIAESCTCR
ncbi:hypothetical protein CRUP_010165 [Coryphaenoides rupestris]|nr:hypothetical protein CRUP_010165 [Coryphaenoides rupestris]